MTPIRNLPSKSRQSPLILLLPLTASLKAGQSYTFEDLRAGSYTITEVTDGLPDGWQCLTPVQTVVLGSSSATTTCTVQNKYVKPLGHLTVTKYNGGEENPDDPTFRIYVRPAQAKPTSVTGESNGDEWPLYVDL